MFFSDGECLNSRYHIFCESNGVNHDAGKRPFIFEFSEMKQNPGYCVSLAYTGYRCFMAQGAVKF